ncbi:MAG: 5-(carboxyamino)imidazole ribonucleotide synthase [Burkholderiaceae bacterium]
MGSQTILPGSAANGQQAILGVMGGGQLGRMFVHAAQRMGYATAVLDPDPASPAGLVSHFHIQTDYQDGQGLAEMAQRCAAITTEFENVPAESMCTLATQRPVAPAASALQIAQDRIREKAHFNICKVPCAPYAAITTPQQLADVPDALLPGILKTAQLGYDGKGQARVADRAALAAAWAGLKTVPCVLEQELALEMECSVIVARGWDGAMVEFPAQRNLHRAGILAVTEVFAGNLPAALTAQATAAARAIAEGLQYVGVLCVEFFVVGGHLLVNEMAPRPHNSGHYTLDACDQSQFDLQVRTMAGLPLAAPRQHSAAVMLNLLGDLWRDAPRGQPDWPAVLTLPGTHLHLYGKSEPRRGRKMGHLTVTAEHPDQALAVAAQAAAMLSLPPL